MFSDEKWFDQDSQYNRQNDCVCVELRKSSIKYFGTRFAHKLPFKVWVGITFKGLTEIVIFPEKKAYDERYLHL